MGDVRLVIRETDRDWSGTIQESCAERVVAALSADPATLEELEIAITRFAKPVSNHRFFGNLSPGLVDEPYDTGLVIIDLIARLILVDSTYFSPGHEGYIAYDDEESCTDKDIGYHLADDWIISADANAWRYLAAKRRLERTAKPPLDSRAIFYGRPMLEFVARESFAAFARPSHVAPDAVPDLTRKAHPNHAAIQQTHAAWLLTPREDLDGACPREIALARHKHLKSDMEDRIKQWLLMDAYSQGLDRSFHAYHFGGWGENELIKYYDLVRLLLCSCYDQLTELNQSPKAGHRRESLTIGDFLATELPRLESLRDAWLDAPDPECHNRTPRSIIERERARLPEAVSGKAAMLDPICPCCQMIAGKPRPIFRHLLEGKMDEGFAFDIHNRTRKEWHEDQIYWEKFNAMQDERGRLDACTKADEDISDSIWMHSFSVGDTQDVPLGIRVFDIGCHLANLIVDLRAGADAQTTPPQTQRIIDRLDRDFGNLREILQSSDTYLAVALIAPVQQHFVETVGSIVTADPDLQLQCESLTIKLHKLLEPPSSEFDEDSEDSDIPF